MKKAVLVLFAAMLCLTAQGCGKKNAPDAGDPEIFVLEARILEIGNRLLLVEPVEGSSEGTGQIYVNTDALRDEASLSCMKTAAVGDLVRIGYDGLLAETYPRQMTKPYSIAPVREGSSASQSSAPASDLMEEIIPSPAAAGTEIPGGSSEKAANFAVRLFQNCLGSGKAGENILVSPLSVLSALAMTENGAKGETLSEMEKVLGMTADGLNAYFKALSDSLAENADGPRFRLANSIWFTNDGRFTVSRDFLQTNADFYGAGAYGVPFDDGTLNEINGWVKDNTDGMIPQILDSISEDAVMYLVNALAFEGAWIEPYDEYQVSPGEFTAEDGTKHAAEFMHSEENVYLEDTRASGFLKYYKGGKYAFAALLPEEGMPISDYAASLTGEKLTRILNSARNTPVITALPKFETAFGTELSDVLKAMGMPAAFDPSSADFSGIGTSNGGNIFISRVLHKTFISVGEQGTKAGAATVVEMSDGFALMTEEPKRVILDRPFVYMLIDCETNLPFFIGALMNTEE